MAVDRVTEWCLFGASRMCLDAGVWAGWVQAVGSILAVLGAALIAVFQVRKQHLSAVALQEQAERSKAEQHRRRIEDDEIAECTKALVVLQAYSDLVLVVSGRLDVLRAGGRYAYLELPAFDLDAPIHLDVRALAFLVQHGSTDTLTTILEIYIHVRNLESALRARAQFYLSDGARGSIWQEHTRTGTRPPFSEWPRLIGPAVDDQLQGAARVVLQQCDMAVRLISRDLPTIRERLVAIYPNARFPLIRRTVGVVPALRGAAP